MARPQRAPVTIDGERQLDHGILRGRERGLPALPEPLALCHTVERTALDQLARSLGAVVRDRRRTIITTAVGVGVLVLIGLVVFGRADQRWLFLVTEAAVLAIVFLSITVITGQAGQISLCQGAFAATGAFTVYQMVQRYDAPVLPAALLGHHGRLHLRVQGLAAG